MPPTASQSNGDDGEKVQKQSRSRSGCLSCRARHKKCDEQFGPTGACQRCFLGSWECVLPPAPGQMPLRTFQHGKRAPPATPRLTAPPKKVAPGTHSVGKVLTPEEIQQRQEQQQVPTGDLPIPPPISPSFNFPALPHPPPQAPPFFEQNPPSTVDAALLGSVGNASVPDLGVDLDNFFQSLDAIAAPSVGLGYWDNDMMHSEGHEGLPNLEQLVNESSASLDEIPGINVGSAPPPLPPLPPHQQQLPPPPPASQPQPPQPQARAPAPIPSLPRPAPRPPASPTSRPEALISPPPPAPDGDGLDPTIAPLYIAWNDGFFRSIPKPVREIVTQRMNNVAATSDLTRCASMAMVLLYRVRSNVGDSGEMEEAQANLLAQSDQYFQQALVHLQTPIPLEAQLIAVLDMQAYQFDQWGAAAAHAILLLGEYFVTEAFGSQPSLNLSTLRDSSSMALRAFAYTDVLHTVCIPRRRTLFAFTSLPGDPDTPANAPSPINTDETDRAVEIHLGLPVGLLLCIAATSNLSAEAGAFPDEIVAVKAQAIEKAIRDWRPLAPDAAALVDSTAYIDELSTAEMWRHTALLYLYQSVHHQGCLSTTIRSCLQQILQIGARVMNAPKAIHNADNYVSACATRSVPWFLAATVAIHSADREMCKKGLMGCGPQKGYQDNLAAIERVWELVDTQGWAIDWRDMLQRERRFVGFL